MVYEDNMDSFKKMSFFELLQKHDEIYNELMKNDDDIVLKMVYLGVVNLLLSHKKKITQKFGPFEIFLN